MDLRSATATDYVAPNFNAREAALVKIFTLK
jgi:hypothetical protein